MSERGLHRIEDDIAETWLEDWAGAGLAELEAFLAKHADFLRFLATREPRSRPRSSSHVFVRAGRAARAASSPAGVTKVPAALSSMPFGIAPTADAFGAPSSNRIMFGIDWIP